VTCIPGSGEQIARTPAPTADFQNADFARRQVLWQSEDHEGLGKLSSW
jgi:hypothetical protein